MKVITKSHECRGYAAYRFMRRYLMKYHPIIAKNIMNLIEAKTAKEIADIEDKVVNWNKQES